MDDHFNRMLAPDAGSSSSRPRASLPFLKSPKFDGSKAGYAFKMGPNGLGYYHDPKQDPPEVDSDSRKRKLAEMSSTRLDKSAIERLLEEADNSDIEALNSVTLKQKKINKNQSQRMKYVDQPAKFMDSEIELHKEINDLYAVSASPDLYPILVEAGSISSILGMVAHENTDISISAVGLLLELMDPETILESDEAICVVDAFLDGQGLELVVQNLSRLDEAVQEDAQGVHDSMAIIENLVEIRPTIAVEVCERTHILKFLMMRLRASSFDANKLYCSEILSILLQTDSVNVKKIPAVQGDGEDGIEMLLQIVYQYRKKDPEGADEKECVQNMFQCICTVIMDKDNLARFLAKEGLELMLRYLKENKFAAAGAIRVISYATVGNRDCCERLLEINGMRFIFPIFMGRGMPHGIKKAGRKEIEECVVSIVCQLCLQLHNCSINHASQRLLWKFSENEMEKLDRCAELFAKYTRVLEQTEREMKQLQQALSYRAASSDPEEAEEAELELEMLNNDDARYLKRLDGGLHLLQQIALVIAFVCVYNNRDTACITKLRNRLDADGLGLTKVQQILREMAASIGDGDQQQIGADKGEGESTEGASGTPPTATLEQRQTIIAWSACVSEIESSFAARSSA